MFKYDKPGRREVKNDEARESNISQEFPRGNGQGKLLAGRTMHSLNVIDFARRID